MAHLRVQLGGNFTYKRVLLLLHGGSFTCTTGCAFLRITKGGNFTCSAVEVFTYNTGLQFYV